MARYDHASIAEKLKQVVAFTEFTASEIDKLVIGGKILFYKKDTTICIEGEATRSLYIILAGAASVFKASKNTGQLSRIAYLEVGSAFGEISLLDNAPRSATVVADSDLEIFELKSTYFDAFLREGGPNLELRFYKRTALNLAEKFRSTNDDFILAQGLLWKYALSPEKKST
jgi:CRP-like cAMP-binding protein